MTLLSVDYASAVTPMIKDNYELNIGSYVIPQFTDVKVSNNSNSSDQIEQVKNYAWPIDEVMYKSRCVRDDGEYPAVTSDKFGKSLGGNLSDAKLNKENQNYSSGQCREWKEVEYSVPLGIANIYPGVDNLLDRAVIVVQPYKFSVDGYIYTSKDFYLEVDQTGLLTSLRKSGYDVILYTYYNQDAGVSHNARGLTLLFNRLEEERSIKSISVTGLSFGGVVARYSLVEREREGKLGKVVTYISYDAPHQGVNVPRSVRETILRLLDKVDVPFCGDSTKCSDARRWLESIQKMFYTRTFQELTVDNPDGDFYRQKLINELKNLGHVSTIPTLALANGQMSRSFGKPTPELMLDFKLNRSFPYKNVFFTVSTNPTYDNAPGSLGDFYQQLSLKINNFSQIQVFKKNAQWHTFVSTQSAIDGGFNNFTEVVVAPYSSFDELHMELTHEKSRKIREWIDRYQQ